MFNWVFVGCWGHQKVTKRPKKGPKSKQIIIAFFWDTPYLGAKLSSVKLFGAKLSQSQIVQCQVVWRQIVLPPNNCIHWQIPFCCVYISCQGTKTNWCQGIIKTYCKSEHLIYFMMFTINVGVPRFIYCFLSCSWGKSATIRKPHRWVGGESFCILRCNYTLL